MREIKIDGKLIHTKRKVVIIDTPDPGSKVVGLHYEDLPSFMGVTLPAEMSIECNAGEDVAVRRISGLYLQQTGIGGVQTVGIIPIHDFSKPEEIEDDLEINLRILLAEVKSRPNK
jgi:hypothetical protein